ncbi:hypothetical protein [Thalassospira sp. TSL5-1]|uniref:hypothetical protein n=1 Tax=Thalassospira sp. TSL5-1 TaxID=1544451 RepID=UPI00093BE106|nr:hypothetical protein [Thalassospira sp. TSL5-1]OKH88117.1 hypothetical protein LF95_15730 [Thalassospira sp. TSL5-1]
MTVRKGAIALALMMVCGLPLGAYAAQCEEGNAATDYPGWQYIENNAARTADSYAASHNPKATYIFATSEVVYQNGLGYVVVLTNKGRSGDISTATLTTNFDFCGDPARLDDSREDLFTVTGGSFNGQHF